MQEPPCGFSSSPGLFAMLKVNRCNGESLKITSPSNSKRRTRCDHDDAIKSEQQRSD